MPRALIFAPHRRSRVSSSPLRIPGAITRDSTATRRPKTAKVELRLRHENAEHASTGTAMNAAATEQRACVAALEAEKQHLHDEVLRLERANAEQAASIAA